MHTRGPTLQSVSRPPRAAAVDLTAAPPPAPLAYAASPIDSASVRARVLFARPVAPVAAAAARHLATAPLPLGRDARLVEGSRRAAHRAQRHGTHWHGPRLGRCPCRALRFADGDKSGPRMPLGTHSGHCPPPAREHRTMVPSVRMRIAPSPAMSERWSRAALCWAHRRHPRCPP